ncbi:GTP-binding protein [Alteromonas sp. MB-3u-76]|uniref:GTPase family protein n=1 Tax=Alteromonas sp. MB-3u-76 TaxID=2058133 RepID=UPI000C301C21|nr:GTPase [Alteromonas sp. MB-3u-76]AUC88562.1 GTP-binding protein [Alteromonas sp. MB-3u-76]
MDILKKDTRERLQALLESEHNYLSEKQKQKVINHLEKQSLNILIVGATGAGKSSTINALFNVEQAKVGLGADPMTMDITRYDMGNLILWDTPGLGDGVAKDQEHTKKIIHQLLLKDNNDAHIIDLVLVVLDGSSRDMGTSFDLINNVILPNLGEKPSKKILVAINQADIAYKGYGGWDFEKNSPTPVGYQFLEEKRQNVKKRIFDSTSVEVEPIYYSAGYQDKLGNQAPFNLSKLLYLLVKKSPTNKRLALRTNLSKKKESWKNSDGRKDYAKETKESFGLGKIVGSVIGFFLGLF